MKRLIALPILLLAVSTMNAGETGAPLPLTTGSVDGWSGVSVLNGAGYGSIPANESVTTVTYYAHENLAAGEHNVQPLIVKGDDNTIWGVGPVSNATQAGDNSIEWGSDAIPDDGNDYYVAFWQWREGVDDDAGGVVAFADGGGSGMFQSNQDGTSYTPAVGDPLDMGHAAGEGGRAYQINFQSVPEPASLGLLGMAIIPFIALLRRRIKH